MYMCKCVYKMTDHAYGYFELQLFDGALKLPLKFCTSYPGEDTLRSNTPTKTGVDGRPTNRIFVLAKKDCEKIKKVDDIEKILEWGQWETYLNVGTVTKPELVSLSKFEGVAELLEQDKAKSKERDITVNGIYPLSKIKLRQYNGRHFHTYPHTAKCKDSDKFHNIYRILALYLELHSSFVFCTFFSKGEELGALYEEDGVLRLAGLYADRDLKPVSSILKFPITKGFQKLANEKFDKLKNENSDPEFILEWRDYVNDTLECKGVRNVTKGPPKKKIINKEQLDSDLTDMFKNL
jgi:hypothetical protein